MRLILVSNRAPVNNMKDENGNFREKRSVGGCANGLLSLIRLTIKKFHENETLWIGWPGRAIDRDEDYSEEILKKFNSYSVFISEEMMDKFYEGFCNKTIWPLFHYFPGLTIYNQEFWENYISVNKIFCETISQIYKPGDTIWVHDYHLMLLPEMLREKFPEASIGFFLHIPFPSYEIFRMLPSEWRKKIMSGLLGADLLGFHTHDYCSYFLQSTLRILGISHKMNELAYNGRIIKADTFPMGIDFEKYHSTAESEETKTEKENLRKNLSNVKLILSIDRQDYSKGILNRLRSYEYFLQKNPEWKNRVTMIMVVVPSRIGVESYQTTKSQIDELVGSINGKFGSIEWTPIIYQYRSLSFHELIALYNLSDVALVTPLRDGMNLIAKEYIAARTNEKGVLILSEMAGAADELDEAIIINPNNVEEISSALLTALEMKEEEQRQRVFSMQQRIKNFDVFKWANGFMLSLQEVKNKQQRMSARILNESFKNKMISQAKRAEENLFLLDYDGTLIPHFNIPAEAQPNEKIMNVLEKLSEKKNSRVVLLSGRDKSTLEKWFGHLPIEMAAEHGLLLREKNKKWKMLKPVRKNWKKKIIPILQEFSEKLPRSFVEEKEFSVVFHYRKANPEFAALRVKELINHLEDFTSNRDVIIHKGSKIVEVRNAGIDKGIAAMNWLSKKNGHSRFVLAIGNDRTDEDLFRVMPKDAFSIKVGMQPSYAKFHLNNPKEAIELLNEFL